MKNRENMAGRRPQRLKAGKKSLSQRKRIMVTRKGSVVPETWV
jgi:hypothetical protein